MKLLLTKLPAAFAERGVYGPSKFALPARMIMLHPDAAASIVRLEKEYPGRVFYSDMFRSPESSLQAVREGRGAQPPGYSGHNFGLSVDVAVGRTTYNLGGSYTRLLAVMADHGWYCHRRDGKQGFESWHFNYLREPAACLAGVTASPKTWAGACERNILATYPGAFDLDVAETQAALARLKMYGGAVDGIAGPLTRESTRCFQRAWGIKDDGAPNPKTLRTLAYVSAERA